jgi:hypothetical protein
MVNIAEVVEPNPPFKSIPLLIDPHILRAARNIYRTFRVLHPKQDRRPQGVAIHRETRRGQLIFREQPILLPGECFVPAQQLESDPQVWM